MHVPTERSSHHIKDYRIFAVGGASFDLQKLPIKNYIPVMYRTDGAKNIKLHLFQSTEGKNENID